MHGHARAQPESTFSIGDVARLTGCKVETIRFYESIGLLPAPHRTAGNQRRYLGSHVDRLRFVLHSREFGLPVDDIRELIVLLGEPKGSCVKAHEIARRQLDQVKRKIERLTALAAELRDLAHTDDDHQAADCHVLTVLADCHRHTQGEGTTCRADGRD